MKKLTPEQRDWLIEEVNTLPKHAYNSQKDKLPDIGVNVVKVLWLIVQCAEDEDEAVEK